MLKPWEMEYENSMTLTSLSFYEVFLLFGSLDGLVIASAIYWVRFPDHKMYT